ncbi:kinase-like domain-containing protein [Fomitopsis serialis]|uniref:kinase-like domain-containing protein n=1 Tax=Fomitopsis serialis TaxID=139415 RepID=UPI00200842C0|nr:kinase-like domain-containing protein [Neoantrodia serialis]KAH9930838.1 kinase-like domain-containing protein [Neoantrodia serialis]
MLNTSLGPNGMTVERMDMPYSSLRQMAAKLSQRRSGNTRGSAPSTASNVDDEECLDKAMQYHTTPSGTYDGADLKDGWDDALANELDADDRLESRTSRSLDEYIDSNREACQNLIQSLLKTGHFGGRESTHDHAKILEIIQAAMSSAQCIRVMKEFAKTGHHGIVINLLDAVLVNINPQTHLYTTVFHALRKLCIEHSDIPVSLVLPTNSVTLDGHPNRPDEKGGCADIYLGQWNGKTVGIKAVRMTQHDPLDALMKKIAKEATLWRRLTHPNIAPFYGIDRQHFDISMICLWMPDGDILKFLKNNPSASRPQLLLDVARGLEYLHSDEVGIVHGDLKGPNILVDRQHRACLTDFGLSAALYGCDTLNTVSCMTKFESTLRWMSPELLNPEGFGLHSATASKYSDVYAYSMVMWEVFTGKVPFYQFDNKGTVVFKIVSGLRPQRPAASDDCSGPSDIIWSIMESCWDQLRVNRPSIADVATDLHNVWGLQLPSGSPSVNEVTEECSQDMRNLRIGA